MAFGRVELLHLAAVGPLGDRAIDAGIHEIDGLAGVIDEVLLRIAARLVFLVPDEVTFVHRRA